MNKYQIGQEVYYFNARKGTYHKGKISTIKRNPFGTLLYRVNSSEASYFTRNELFIYLDACIYASVRYGEKQNKSEQERYEHE